MEFHDQRVVSCGLAYGRGAEARSRVLSTEYETLAADPLSKDLLVDFTSPYARSILSNATM
jgi:hypothetical protein